MTSRRLKKGETNPNNPHATSVAGPTKLPNIDINNIDIVGARKALQNITQILDEQARSTDKLIDDLTKIHNDTTDKLAANMGLTTKQYIRWMEEKDGTTLGVWVDYLGNDDAMFIGGKFVTKTGDVVTMEADSYYHGSITEFQRYIGNKAVGAKFSAGKIFDFDDMQEIEDLIKANLH